MKVAVYYPWIHLKSGAERSILEFARRSRHDITLFTNHYDSAQTYPEFSSLEVVELARVPVDRSFSSVMRAGWAIAMQRIDLARFEALVVVCEGMGDMVLFRNCSIPTGCLCLTPMRPVFDEMYRAEYLKGKGFVTQLQLQLFSTLFRGVDCLAWKKYRRILCISRETYRRVVKGGLASEDRLGFAFPGINYQQLTPSGKMEKYFLLPGRIMWTKNIELGINAFKTFMAEFPGTDFRLVVAGHVDAKSQEYFGKLKHLAGGAGNVQFVPHPDDRQLYDLYDRAYAVLFTPFNEDWGIVPLEAMAYGKPIVAVNRGGALETVVHGESGYLADPTPEAFAQYMGTLARDPEKARQMGATGRVQVARYDWSHFVGDIDSMIDEIVFAGT